MKSLQKMTGPELRQLIADAEAALAQREQSERAELKQRMEAMAAEVGISLHDLIGRGRKPSKIGAPRDIKFRHPSKPNLTWTGRGRRPLWLNGAKNIERFRVE
jgi:DNA-binding protein H-NS